MHAFKVAAFALRGDSFPLRRGKYGLQAVGTTVGPSEGLMEALNRELEVTLGFRAPLEQRMIIYLYLSKEDGTDEEQFGTLVIYDAQLPEDKQFAESDGAFFTRVADLPWETMDECDRWWIRYLIDHPQVQPEPRKIVFRRGEDGRDRLVSDGHAGGVLT